MPVAGRSYPNVPVIVRGALEDPTDFGSRTRVVVVTSRPRPQPPQPAVILRSTLQDPPVLTTPSPVVVAAQPARRWFDGRTAPTVVIQAALPPPALTTPQPVLVTRALPDRRQLSGSVTVISGAARPVSGGLIMTSFL